MKPIDGEKLLKLLEDEEPEVPSVYIDLVKDFIQEKCQLPIKSPEEVERVIKHFSDCKTCSITWNPQDMIDLCEWILGKNKSYDRLLKKQDEDFREHK